MSRKVLNISLNKYDEDIIDYLEKNKDIDTISSITKKLIRKAIEIEKAAIKDENKKNGKIDTEIDIKLKLNNILDGLDELKKQVKHPKIVYYPKIVYKGKTYNKFI